jgi:hypothetical protein
LQRRSSTGACGSCQPLTSVATPSSSASIAGSGTLRPLPIGTSANNTKPSPSRSATIAQAPGSAIRRQ